jgi:hypothetical protein
MSGGAARFKDLLPQINVSLLIKIKSPDFTRH